MDRIDRKKPQKFQVETVPNASSLSNSAPMSSADDLTNQQPIRTVEVDFVELEDGTLVELIQNPQDATKSLLAIWKNGQVRYVEKFECGNQVLVPIPRNAGMIRHVHLATGAECFDSAETLLADIISVLVGTLELSLKQQVLLGSFVMSTWFVEKLPVAPYAAFLGPPGSGKTTALRILNLLCRRSLLTADISSAAFYEVCDRMTTTLLIDETATVDNRRKLLHLLRTGTTPDFVAVRKGSTSKSYGARAISWIELPDDAALNSRCLLIPMTICKRTDLLAPTDPRVLHAAEMLQRRLLQFRLTNYKQLTPPAILRDKELQPRTRDLLRALTLPLGEQKEICEVIFELLKSQEPLRQLLSVYQSVALDSLYRMIHSYPKTNGLRVLWLTEDFNANLQRRGEPGRVSEKKFSNILTSLKLTSRTRTNSGYVLWLNRETREQIHSIARLYGVNTGLTPNMTADCEFCQIIGGRPTGGSTTKPVAESKRAEANTPREHREHREREKRRTKRAQARVVPAASSSRR